MGLDFSGWLRRKWPDLTHVAARFPVPLAMAALLTGYLLLDMHKAPGADLELRLYKVPMILGTGFLWSLSAALYGEAHKQLDAFKAALGAAGIFILAVLILLDRMVSLQPALLSMALLLGVGFAPYLRRPRDNAAFWRFNHDLFVGSCAAIIAILMFAGGLSLILESLRYLFGVQVPGAVHEKIWTLACGFVGPAYALSLIPQNLDQRVVEGPQAEFTSRAVAALAKFILVPLLLAYGLILHAYAIKIGLDGALPKGRLGWLTLSFGLVTIITALACFPTRQVGGRLVAQFWRLWPWALVVPMGLLALAITVRIGQHGLTPARYLAILMGLWMAALALAELFWKGERDLRLPSVLAVGLLAIASIGPWGAQSASVRSQARDFANRLAIAGMTRNGVVTADARPATTLLASDRERLHGALSYLASERRLIAVRSIFATAERDPFATASGAARTTVGDTIGASQALADRIRDRLGIGRPTGVSGNQFASYHTSAPATFRIVDRESLLGPFNMSAVATSKPVTKSVETLRGKLTVTMEPTRIQVTLADGRGATFDLATLGEAGGLLGPDVRGSQNTLERPPVEIKPQSGDLAVSLVLINGSGNFRAGDRLEMTFANFWLLLGPAR